MCHIGEPWTEVIEIRSDERIRKKVDMVPDNHQVAYLEIEIDAAGSIGNEEIPYPYDLHYPDRQCDKLHRITLVIMNPALHCNDSLSA